MVLLLLFAFIVGIVTILSPCILPVLPIILAGGIGGKNKPIGVIIGFIGSFTFSVLFLVSLTRFFSIDPAIIRAFAIVCVFVLGLTLLSKSFEEITERLFSRLVSGVSTKLTGKSTNNSFWSGIVVGLGAGILWAPCVGPILATVVALAAQGQVTTFTLLVTVSYAIGTSIPLFAILIGGRRIIERTHVRQMVPTIRKVFGVLSILTAIALVLNFDIKFENFVAQKFPQYGAGLTQLENNSSVSGALSSLKNSTGSSIVPSNKAPELVPTGQWFNLPAGKGSLTLQELRGKVVMVDFWTYTCINCVRTIPYLTKWYNQYHPLGLEIIGVHTPEFVFEKDPVNVQKAIKDLGVNYPVVQDNLYLTWSAYNNEYWPATYFIDKDGNIRWQHFGEGNYDETENMIQKLLTEAGAKIDKSVYNPSYQIDTQTPETYLGAKRMESFASPEKILNGTESNYSIPQNLPDNNFAFAGKWTVMDEYSLPTGTGTLALKFNAKNVYLVAKPSGTNGKINVMLDGTFTQTVNVDGDKLYTIVSLDKQGSHMLNLEVQNVEVYAFTFG